MRSANFPLSVPDYDKDNMAKSLQKMYGYEQQVNEQLEYILGQLDKRIAALENQNGGNANGN